jgi:hypothetical protein
MRAVAVAQTSSRKTEIGRIDAGKQKLEAVERDLTGPHEPDWRKTNQNITMKIRNVSSIKTEQNSHIIMEGLPPAII